MQGFWIAALAFGIVIALFAVQNSAPTTIRFLWISAEAVPLSVLVMICAALGALVTLMFGLGREVRLQWSRRSARRMVSTHEKRIAELEKAVEELTAQKAALDAQVASLTATGGTPLYEAVPVNPSAVEGGTASTSLPSGDSSKG
ncbi:MAG: DUF1049 domain-containing protein [Chloroflexi bacterium]|nr:DUF1049 domain-containing protein [Chloroflexota bacterium]